MGISNCLKYKNVTPVTDFNNIQELGIYLVIATNETGEHFTDLTANSPVGAYRHGNVIVFKNTQVYIPDMYSSDSRFGVFIRVFGQPWFKINVTAYV